MGRISRFGAKFIVVHQPHLRIWGEDISVISHLYPVVNIKSEFSIHAPFIFETRNYDVFKSILFDRNVI